MARSACRPVTDPQFASVDPIITGEEQMISQHNWVLGVEPRTDVGDSSNLTDFDFNRPCLGKLELRIG